jgi:hypothetical protein
MDMERIVLVRCRFIRGGFPSERIFLVRGRNGGELRGVAPVQYCYTSSGKQLGDEPAEGKELSGFVVGLEIQRSDDKISRVYLPDGDVYDLGTDQVELVAIKSAEKVFV